MIRKEKSMNSLITTNILVKDNKIGIVRVGDVDYISLTDLARYINPKNPSDCIRNWISTKYAFNYYSLWEELYNPNFNSAESHVIKINELTKNTFSMTPTKWKIATNAIGIIPSAGKYSKGTYAHPDIALEFAGWISPEFRLYLNKEFKRLKENEAYQNKVEWQTNRLLSKPNYLVHTDAVKNYIIPKVSKEQINKTYADEADIINVALFGMTAKEWRDKNPSLKDKGNIRDYTDMIHLIILRNLENINANLITKSIKQSDRLVELNNIAINQLELFKNNKSIEELKQLEERR